MANVTQPDNPSDAADALIDQYLGVSDDEDTTKTPSRKTAASGDPENEPDEEPSPSEEPAQPEEDEEETGDTDSEDDAGAKEDADQSEEDEQGRFVGQNGRVKLPDGSTITVGELMRGNLRMADYTRKTQETGALHQELQARLADYAQQENIVQLAIDVMAGALPPEPDMRLLEDGEYNDPIAFTNQKLRWEAAAQQLQQMQMAKQQMVERNAAIQGTLLKQYAIAQKDRLLSYKPELTDRSKLEAYNNHLLKTLSRYGKGAADLAQVYDADIIRMIEHLGNYHQILAERKRARQKTQGTPVLAPSTRQSPAGRKAKTRQNDWETLRKTGARRGSAGEAALDRILDDLI